MNGKKKEWEQKNRKRMSIWKKQWYQKNKKRIIEKQRTYYESYYEENQERLMNRQSYRRYRKWFILEINTNVCSGPYRKMEISKLGLQLLTENKPITVMKIEKEHILYEHFPVAFTLRTKKFLTKIFNEQLANKL